MQDGFGLKSMSLPQSSLSLDSSEISPSMDIDIEETLKLLDEIWLEGYLKETMTEEEYLSFRKAVEESKY